MSLDVGPCRSSKTTPGGLARLQARPGQNPGKARPDEMKPDRPAMSLETISKLIEGKLAHTHNENERVS